MRVRGNSKRVHISQAGFTLIEIMVALAILAVLTMLTAQSMKSAIDNRIRLSADISRDAKLSDALQVMRNDIANAFHYRDIHVVMYNEMIKEKPVATPTPRPGAPAESITYTEKPPLGTPRPTPAQVTHFVGESNSLYFTSLSNSRTLMDSQESDQAKIGYFLKSCKPSGKTSAQNTNCLFRSVSPFLSEDVTTGGRETMLVEHVEEFKLRYLGLESKTGTDDYRDSWKTGNGGDEMTKLNFPLAVEITLTIHNKDDKRDKPATLTVLAPIRFPNNPPKKKAGAAAGQEGQTGQPDVPDLGSE